MKKIRIGNDIHITWEIFRDGNPEDWEDKDLSLRLIDPMGRDCPIINVSFDETGKAKFSFLGKDQHRIGCYMALLEENKGDINMTTVDHINAFSLVKHTCDIGGHDTENLRVESVEIEDDIIGDAAFFVVNGEVCIQYEDDAPSTNDEVTTPSEETEESINQEI